MAHKFQQQATQNYRQQYTSHQPEGRIRVDYIPPKEKETRSNNKSGEFIDYEEVK